MESMGERTTAETEASGKPPSWVKDAQSNSAQRYALRLYVTGITRNSRRAITNVRKICDDYLRGRCDLEVIDIYQQPDLAKAEQLLAAPTLVKRSPLPLRKFIGDMSNTERILQGLNLHPAI
jgi:circadian clock protein KaiB